MSRIGDARTKLARAKDAYQDELRAVDSMLRHAVRQDPALIHEAKAMQDTYHQGFHSSPLAALVQPAGPPLPATPIEAPSLDSFRAVGAATVEQFDAGSATANAVAARFDREEKD